MCLLAGLGNGCLEEGSGGEGRLGRRRCNGSSGFRCWRNRCRGYHGLRSNWLDRLRLNRSRFMPVRYDVLLSCMCDDIQSRTYEGASKSSPPRFKLPNCMPIFSIPEPKLAGSTTGWSVLNLGFVRCETGVGLVEMEGVRGLAGSAAGDSGAGCCTTPGGPAEGACSCTGSSGAFGAGSAGFGSSVAAGAEIDSVCCGGRGSSSHVGAWTVVGSSQPVEVAEGSMTSGGGEGSG